jgi:hypothetical protein
VDVRESTASQVRCHAVASRKRQHVARLVLPALQCIVSPRMMQHIRGDWLGIVCPVMRLQKAHITCMRLSVPPFAWPCPHLPVHATPCATPTRSARAHKTRRLLRWNHARSGLARNQEYARACASIQCAYASGFGPIIRWAPNCFAQVTTGTSRRCGRCCTSTPSAPRVD